MRKNKNKKLKKTVTAKINIALVVVVVVSFFAHLVVANHGANQRYEISQFLGEFNVLQDDTQKMSLRVIELQSTERIAAESQRLNLVKADSVYYVSPKGSVALGEN